MLPYIEIFPYTINCYDVFTYMGAVILLLYNFSQARQKRSLLSGYSLALLEKNRGRQTLLAKETFYVVAELLLVTILVAAIGSGCNGLWAKISTNNRANYFGNIYFLPPLFVLVSRVLRIPPCKQLDYCTPGISLALVSAKIGCFCAGCCFGFPMEGSFYYNYDQKEYQFPIQLVEGAVALALFFVLRAYQKRNRYPGSVFPLFVVLYSGTRFCTEFLRADFEPLVWRLTTYHFQCLAGLLLGVIELLLLRKFTVRISAWEDSLQTIKKQTKSEKIRRG